MAQEAAEPAAAGAMEAAAAAAAANSSAGPGPGAEGSPRGLLAAWPSTGPAASPSPLPSAAAAGGYSAAAVAGLSALVGALIVFTVAGNALVVLAVLGSRALRAPQNLFLVSLAGADILVAALVMPFSLANELMGGWAFGPAWCRVYLALDVLFCTASIVHLCAISLDRYCSVARALQYNGRRTAGRIKGAIAAAWLLSAAVSSPPLLLAGQWERDGDGEGGAPPPPPPRCRLNDQTWYILASCGASFFAPCLIMLLVYARIYRVAKLRTRTLSARRPPAAQADHSSPAASQGQAQGGRRRGGDGDGDGDEARRGPPRPSLSAFASLSRRAGSGRSVGGQAAREKRFSLVLAVVMGVFVVCWFPFFFSYSLYGICREACQAPEALFKFFFWIGYCNSSLNPVIYTIFNQDFRRAFKHILFGGGGSSRRKNKKKKAAFFLH